jgi:hypothetical protein
MLIDIKYIFVKNLVLPSQKPLRILNPESYSHSEGLK